MGLKSPRRKRTDLGVYESLVQRIEETSAASLPADLTKRLARRRETPEKVLHAAALAAARSVRPGGTPPPLSLSLVLAGFGWLRDLENASSREDAVTRIVRIVQFVRQEMETRPFELMPLEAPPVANEEDTIFAFLEAVSGGDVDTADRLFGCLVSDLTRERATDLLISAILPGAGERVHKLLAPIEALSILQSTGWETSPVLLRWAARSAADGAGSTKEYDEACEVVSARRFLRGTVRRTPGSVALGEQDPPRLWSLATAWAEGDPAGRRSVVADALAEGASGEDLADVLGLGVTMLFLQECSRASETAGLEEGIRRAAWAVLVVQAYRSVVRLGTPGQRSLALLLAGSAAPVAAIRLQPQLTDGCWWMSPAQRLNEPTSGVAGPSPAGWIEALDQRSPNGLLPALSRHFETGASGLLLQRDLTLRVSLHGDALAAALERSFAALFSTTRGPSRWLHLWASSLAYCVWDAHPGVHQGLSSAQGFASFPTGVGPMDPRF